MRRFRWLPLTAYGTRSTCHRLNRILAMPKIDLLQGTLDMLILRVINTGSMHGWGIAQRIEVLSDQRLNVEEGSLYPALYRLEQNGWTKAEWGQSENKRRARFYKLTAAGRKQLEAEKRNWHELSGAIGQIMDSI